MLKLAKEVQMRDFALFMKDFHGVPPLELEYFHPFQCPVAVAEAKVNEHRIQEYSVFSLLILRLVHAGFKTEEQIASISGMSKESVSAYLIREIQIYQHIDPETMTLTEMGLKTLEENPLGSGHSGSESELRSHVIYNTPRHIQIEAVTGSVIPSYLERGGRDGRDAKPDEDLGYFILPRESVIRDAELQREMNERLREYIDSDYVDDGDIIENVTDLKTVRLFYRWAYLVKFRGMKYNLIVMTGKRRVDNVNARSNLAGNFDREVAVPLAISESDRAYLENNGIVFGDSLVRADLFFEYLEQKIEGLELAVVTEDAPSSKQEVTNETVSEEDQ